MDKELKRKELELLGVHDLRNIARTVGVVGPTMKVKEQLIDEIIGIISGGQQVDNSTIKRGRKAKANFLTGEANITLPAELSAIIHSKEKQKHALLGKNIGPLFLNQNPTSNIMEIEEKIGYLLSENGIFYFFDISEKKSMVYVPEVFAPLNLQIGDKIYADCQKMPGNNVYFVKKIFEINNINVENNVYNRKLCNFASVAKSAQKLFFENVTEGDFVTKPPSTTFEEFLETYSSMLSWCQTQNITTVFFGVNLNLHQQNQIETLLSKNSEIFEEYLDDPENCFEGLVNSVNNSVIRASGGEKVLLIIFNFNYCLNALRKLSKISNLSEKDIACIIDRIKKLNRVLENNGSLTTLII